MGASRFPLNGELFKARHWDEAWQILLDGCEVPPSYEVFAHGLREATRSGRSVTPNHYATLLAREYRRVEM